MPESLNSFIETSLSRMRKEALPILQNVKSDGVIYLIIVVIALSVTLFSSLSGYGNRISLFAYMYAMPSVVMVTAVIVAVGYFFVLAARREPRPLLCYWNKIQGMFASRDRVISGFILLTGLSVFISSFSTMKGLIPLIHPFEYDRVFHDIDFWLAGGHEPWLIAHSILSSPYFTLVINYSYKIWFFLLWGILSYFILAKSSFERTRYLISWILCWTVLGMVVAMALSSAGPAFTIKLDPSNRDYVELMSLLKQQDIWLEAHNLTGVMALKTQDDLWQAYSVGTEMLGSGISAMPSMHVSMAVLMMLAMSQINKALGAIFGLFACIIFVGSFFLGWHFMIDGLVSGVLTVLIWLVSGRISAAVATNRA